MTDTISTETKVGPDKRITYAIGFLAALWASWGPYMSLAGILGGFLFYVFITLFIPYAIAKSASKDRPFNGWLFLILTILAGAIVIGAEVTSKS